MNDFQLTEEEFYILDIISSLEPLLQYQISGIWLSKNQPLLAEQLNEILNKLSKLQLISVEQAQYQTIISINASAKEKVANILSDFWKRKKVDKDILLAEAEKNHNGVLKLLELKSALDNKSHVTFSDYYWDSQLHDFCQKLADAGMTFKQTWSSRKHTYENYYLRKIPINVEKTLQDFVLSKVNPEGLDLETDWRVLAISTFSEIAPKVKDVALNFPNLTSDEVNEIVARLENRGILTREREELKLPKATKDIIKSFFVVNRYQTFKNLLTQQLRRRVGERTSNLFLIGLIKRIITSVQITKSSEPFFVVKRNLIKNVDEADLLEAAKLGIVLLTENEVIIAQEVLSELETILQSAVLEKPIIRIPANDIYTAIVTWKKIFGECEDYVNIQDEYVNEETLQIVQSYSPSHVEITVLTSIEGGWKADVEEMKQRIDAIRKSGKNIELFFIGNNEGKAPFHFRYILSKNLCYNLTHTIKQFGKSKDADLIPISLEEKQGLVEPAFNYWISLPRKKLEEIGINRMNFDEWLKYISSSRPIK